jgi:hypothetical protein
MSSVLAVGKDYGMPTEIFNVLQILLTILSIVIAIIGVISIIKPILDNRREKQLKEMQKKIDNMEKTIKNLNNRLLVFSGKLNLTENMYFDNYDKDINYKQLNNMGMLYLKKARLVNDNESLKEQYLNEAIICFKKSVKKIDKTYGIILLKSYNYGLDIIYSNLSDAYDDYADNCKIDKQYYEYKSKAEKSCSKAIGINENCWQAYNMLASIYLDKYFKATNDNEKNKLLDKAKKNAIKSLDINKCNGYALLTLAEILIIDNYEQNKETIKSYIKRALAKGCPVWEYIEGNKNNRYEKLNKDTSTSIKVLRREINDSEQVSNMARVSLQSEAEYLA